MATEFARPDALSHSEGRIAKTIENQTAKLPSDTFLWMAVGAMTASATLQIMGNRHVSLFVGQWAPTVLNTQCSRLVFLTTDSRFQPAVGCPLDDRVSCPSRDRSPHRWNLRAVS